MKKKAENYAVMKYKCKMWLLVLAEGLCLSFFAGVAFKYS